MEEDSGYDKDPHLSKVFPKHDSQEEFDVDIVAVHGLDTSSPKTWVAYERDGPPDVRGHAFNWLSDDDMLPAVVPKARIWTFDYNANYHTNASLVDLLALGEMLLRSLSTVRTNEQSQSRPLLFIGSCFGGLIVVKALESAGSFQSEFAHIIRATTSVLFLGTPLRGTRAANSAQWRILLAGIRGHEVSSTLISDLNQNSIALRNLVQIFSAKAIKRELRLDITCFYETRTTEVLNAVLPRSMTQFFPKFSREVLVGQESACLDGHDQIPLDARHAMMNKYRGPDDRNWLLVSNQIRRYVLDSHKKLALRASSIANRAREQNSWQPNQKEVECHQILRTSNYESHRERNPDRVDGTCRWFLEHPHYQYWWKSNTSNLLWVSADPGCGKSVLAKSLVGKELITTDTHATCYFFFKDDNVEQASATSALCALLHQLFEQRKPLIRHAMSDFRSNGVHLPGLFERLWGILKEAAADAQAGTIVCIIDALDECEESGRTRLLRYLDHFYSDTTSNNRRNMALKFLITSRPYFHIERDLQSLVSKYPVIRLSGEAETQSISREINLVIKAEVRNLGQTLKLDKSVQLILEEELSKFTNRTYLWLHLILEVVRERLESVSQKQIRSILSSVPQTVDKAYSAILERSENKRRAKKLLHIIVSAIRPLTLREMNTAMRMEASCTSHDDLDLLPEEKWKVIIRNLCGLFVTVIDSRVYLIHQTAREFLLCNCNPVTTAQDPDHTQIWKHSLTLGESNLILARICIWYLLFTVFEVKHLQPPPDSNRAPRKEDVLDYTNKHPFLSYAAEFWACHFREAQYQTDMELLQSVSLKICDTQSGRFSNWFSVYWTMSKEYESFYPREINSLMVASHLGLDAAVRLLLQHRCEINGRHKLDRTALSWAAEAGHVAVVKLLLEECTSPIVRNRDRNIWRVRTIEYKNKIRSVFKVETSYAGKNDLHQPSLVPAAELPLSYYTARTRLPEQWIDINNVDIQGNTPLMFAANNGHRPMVELLLEHNAKMDCSDVDGYTAAIKAADRGHEDVVMLLLKQTARMRSKNKHFGPVLIAAARYGQEAVVKLLLDCGVNKESKDESGRTALSVAAGYGRPHVVGLLLKHNADIESKDYKGHSPLMCAVQNSQDNTVALLLQHNANAEAKNNTGQTAMALAFQVLNGRAVVLRWSVLWLLLEHGAIVKSDDGTDVALLLEAARKGQINVLRFLLERDGGLGIESKGGPGVVQIDNSLTPLSQAAVGGQKDVVEFLLERNANIEARDSKGNTPLSLATGASKDTVIELLLEYNADIESRNERGETPLLRTVSRERGRQERPGKNETVVEILLNHGANMEAKDDDDMTPLLCAVKHGWAGVVKLLLEHNVNVDCGDPDGRTALQLAEFLGDKTVLTHLLRHKTDSSSEQSWSRSPLSEAAEKGHESVVKQYLDDGHDIEAKDDIFGQSPLSWAVENGQEAVVKLLLDRNAQIESKNKYGQTALWLAARHGHARVVKLLIERNVIADAEDNVSRTPFQVAHFHQHTGIEVQIENYLRWGNDTAAKTKFYEERLRAWHGKTELKPGRA